MFDLLGFWAAVTLIVMPIPVGIALIIIADFDSRVKEATGYRRRFGLCTWLDNKGVYCEGVAVSTVTLAMISFVCLAGIGIHSLKHGSYIASLAQFCQLISPVTGVFLCLASLVVTYVVCAKIVCFFYTAQMKLEDLENRAK